MQVPAAVVQVVELTLVGQGQGFKVAQRVVSVFQFPGTVGLAKQLAEGIVGVVESLLAALDVDNRLSAAS